MAFRWAASLRQRQRLPRGGGSRRQRDPAILEQIGDNLFQMRVFPVPARDEKRILLDFALPLEGGIGFMPSGQPKVLQCLVDFLGIDMFATVIWIALPREAMDRDLQPVGELSSLEFVAVNDSRVSDEGLRCLQGAKRLQHVFAFDTKVTAEGAAQLERLCPGCTVYCGSFEEVLRAIGD